MPTCTILDGANGSGKSSISEALALEGEFVNADLVARVINPDYPARASFAAGRVVLRRLTRLIDARESFAYETTSSGNQPLDLMRRVGAAGYQVGLVFVILADVELNVKRVAQRVSRGGHDIPETMIRRRHAAALSRLGAALALADEAIVLDNTRLVPRPLLKTAGGAVIENALDAGDVIHAAITTALVEAGLQPDGKPH